MPINLKTPQLKELKPCIMVCGVGGAGGNAIVANTSGRHPSVVRRQSTATNPKRRCYITNVGWLVLSGFAVA